MAKLPDQFDEFLSNINPSTEAVKHASTAHIRVRDCLEKQDEFKQYVDGSFLYGSYMRSTAVGDIKDVDVVVLTNFDIEDDNNSPQRVLKRLKDALARCYDDPENPRYQRRSIRVDDPLPEEDDVELTLDIIPAVVITNAQERLKVPDREVQEWIWSHPRGHLAHTTDLNQDEHSKGRYVPLVKIMKWWWKHQCDERQPEVERPHPKGFWVECLTSETFDPEQTAYADHFIVVLERILEEYGDSVDVPELADPGLEDEVIKTSMTKEEFDFFLRVVEDSLDQAKRARDEEDKVKSSELWREIFGDEFPLYDEEEIEETKAAARVFQPGDASHAEHPSWDMQLKGHKSKVRISARLYSANKAKMFRTFKSNSKAVRSGLWIKFEATTRIRGGYDVYWQVVNTGRHAKAEDDLRGKIFLADSNQPLVQWEHTLYTGKHWIECYIVQDGVCVARSRPFYVNIRNPNSP